MRGFRCLLACVFVSCLACGSNKPKPPPVYPVTGRVIGKDGKPMTAGVIEFASTSGSGLTTQSELQADGRFELFTLFENQRLQGAVEGEYKVTVFPPMTGERGAQPHLHPKPIKVEAKAIELTIDVRAR